MGTPETAAATLVQLFQGPDPVVGVVTQPDQRGRGLGARVVGPALDELARRGLLARYQVHEENIASIRLAESLGMQPLLRLTHYLHEHRTPGGAKVSAPA